MECFARMLQVYGATMWEGGKTAQENARGISGVLNSNSSYRALIKRDPERLVWYHDYLMSIWKHEMFEEALVQMTTSMCKDIQNSHVDVTLRALTMTVLASVSTQASSLVNSHPLTR